MQSAVVVIRGSGNMGRVIVEVISQGPGWTGIPVANARGTANIMESPEIKALLITKFPFCYP
jgi:hypothetical protein